MMYYYEERCKKSFSDVESDLRDALKERGFGILTEIDVQQKLHEKLGVEIENYLILGACNPPKAYELLQHEQNAGVLLPCNVIVRTEEDEVIVACQLPTHLLSSVGSKQICALAEEVEVLLKEAVAAATKSI